MTTLPDLDSEVLAAFHAYERALAQNDLTALDDAFVPGANAIRGDAAGLLVGHAQIQAFRNRRGGATQRTVREVHGRMLGSEHAVIVSVNEPQQGGTGLVTQVWGRCADGRWRILAAQVAAPPAAADPRIWRLVGFPLIPPSGTGALAGHSVAVKDVFEVAGFPVGAGNPAVLAEARPAAAHAAAVRVLLDAGAEVRGIARTDEFAYSIVGANAHYGTPPNSRAPHRLPGGSSSGPASAVALGQASIGLGTDTAGSIRVPASYQGLWGLRSTHGLVDRTGMAPLAPGFDAVGWLARDARTLALAAQASLPPRGAAGSADDRYALCPALLETVQPEVRAAFTERLAGWIGTGALPTPALVDLPDPTETFEAFRVAQGAEAWQSHGTWIREHPGALGPDVAARFAWASTITADEAAAARTALARARAQIDAALGDSTLLSPTTPTPAPLLSADAAALDAARAATITLTCLAPITGRPALSVPLLHAEGVPVGLSLLGLRDTDLDLIARASALADTDAEADTDPR